MTHESLRAVEPPAPPVAPAGRSVFASEDGRRARVLRAVALVVVALAAAWLAALLAGAFGFARFPDVSLPHVGAITKPHPARSAPAKSLPEAPVRVRAIPAYAQPPQRRSRTPAGAPGGGAPLTPLQRPVPSAGRPTTTATPSPPSSVPTASQRKGQGKPDYTPSGHAVPDGRASRGTRPASGVTTANGLALGHAR